MLFRSGIARTFLFIGLPAAVSTVGLVFALMEAHRFLTTNPKFSVRRVEISSKGPAENDELVRLAGIAPGSNIFTIDLEEVRRRVERHPWVHDATVIRNLPNLIQISYRAQEPKAILGAESMYYLNAEGIPFYRVQRGDSLAYPLIQVDGKTANKEQLKERVVSSMKILRRLKESRLFHEKDLGDITILADSEEEGAPYLLSLRYPPKPLATKLGQSGRLYTVSLGEEDFDPQIKHWEAVVRHLVQGSKKPRLIRLELGKKVVVKLEK